MRAPAGYQYVSKTYAYNPTFYDNPNFEKLYADLNASVDPNKRTDLLYKLQQIAYDDPPIIFLYKQVDFYGVNKRLNWEPRRDELIVLKTATLK